MVPSRRTPLVVEVLVPRRQRARGRISTPSGRPAMLADFIGESYRRGLTPQFWKIEGTPAADGARTIDRAIAAQPQCRQIILGKAADIATIERWFAAASESATAVGFAIGRSVFWEPRRRFLPARRTAAEAAAHICANYLALVDAWKRAIGRRPHLMSRLRANALTASANLLASLNLRRWHTRKRTIRGRSSDAGRNDRAARGDARRDARRILVVDLDAASSATTASYLKCSASPPRARARRRRRSSNGCADSWRIRAR